MRRNNAELSRYRTAVSASNSKRFLATFFDILIAFILSLSLFSIGDLILTNTSTFKANAEESSTYQEKLYELVEDSHLSTRENGSLKHLDDICDDYIYSLTLLSLQKIKPIDEISENTYKNIKPLTSDTDRLYYYHVIFKKAESDNFINSSYKDVDSYFDFFVTEDVNMYYVKSDEFPILNDNSALLLDDYLVNNSSEGKKIYDTIHTDYLSVLNDSIDEFTTSYKPYIETNSHFEDCTKKQLNLHGIVVLVTFLLSVLILYLVLPFIFRDGKTISMKVLGLAYCDVRGYEVSWVNICLRTLFSFIANCFSLFLIMLLAFGTEGTYFMQINVLGFFNLFTAFIISIVYLFFSGIVSLIPRKVQEQSLTDILSITYLKNAKEFYSDEVRHFKNGK